MNNENFCQSCGGLVCTCGIISSRPDENYNKKEFEGWFNKLMWAANPCFFRDILRAEKKTLWERYKQTADEYHDKIHKGEDL